MKNNYTLLLCFFCCITGFWANAQLYTDAGVNRTICRGDSVTLGGTDTAATAVAPFTYQWQPATGLSATNVANPIAHPAVNTTYYLTSSDANGVVSLDSVTVRVKFSDTHLTASDSLICPSQLLQVTSGVLLPGCANTADCFGNSITPSVGNGTVIQSGTPAQGPSLFGNFRQSSRSQMLYTRAELQAALGGPAVIKSLTFNNGVFNSNAQLRNFAIKMGCAFQDSLTSWNDNLVTVFSTLYYMPSAGWNNKFDLETPFYWDGYSDLLIDICNYNPNSFGNQNNKAECTQTTFISYLYSAGSTDQCGGGTLPVGYYQRPNVKFNYCEPVSVPSQILDYDMQWTAGDVEFATGQTSFTCSAYVYSSGYFYFTISDSICSLTDSIYVSVHDLGLYNSLVDVWVDSTIKCYGDSTGEACVWVVGGVPPFQFLWDSVYEGTICNNALTGGSHFVVLRDTFGCETKTNFSINQPAGPLTVVDTSYQNILYLDIGLGTVPYTINWGDGTNTTAYTSEQHIYANNGVYDVLVTDANGCQYATTVTIIGTGLAEPLPADGFTIYPNPVGSILHFSALKSIITEVFIYDALGRTITVTKQVSGNSIDVSGLVPGVYTLAIHTTTGLFNRRFIKQL